MSIDNNLIPRFHEMRCFLDINQVSAAGEKIPLQAILMFANPVFIDLFCELNDSCQLNDSDQTRKAKNNILTDLISIAKQEIIRIEIFALAHSLARGESISVVYERGSRLDIKQEGSGTPSVPYFHTGEVRLPDNIRDLEQQSMIKYSGVDLLNVYHCALLLVSRYNILGVNHSYSLVRPSIYRTTPKHKNYNNPISDWLEPL